jgi:hypothetical protein
MLITRHILFLGFSLTDDNFHAVIDEVRRAIDGDASSGASRERFGTAIVHNANAFAKDLWGRDLSIVDMDPPCRDDEMERRPLIASRRNELFLDYLVYKATMPIAHFFDQAYDGAMTDSDRKIREALLGLRESIKDLASEPSVAPILQVLRRYGLRL